MNCNTYGDEDRDRAIGRQVATAGWALLLALLAVSGCQSILGIGDVEPDELDAAVVADAMADAAPPDAAPPDAIDCSLWVPASEHFDACAIPVPGRPLILDLDEYEYDTSAPALRPVGGAPIAHQRATVMVGGIEVLLVSTESFTVMQNTRLRVIGDKPLLIASWNDITIDGQVDASSSMGDPGAGTRDDCANAAEPGTNNGANHGGGGGGGGFGGSGGNGGTSITGNNAGSSGGTEDPGGLVRGGCRGGDGGRAQAPDIGVGGAGGGAIQLTARTGISVAGVIHTGGAGGGGGFNNSGGGGGGSGGMINLDAPDIVLAPGAILAANGGGGGGGSGDGLQAPPGASAQPGLQPAPGGSANSEINGGVGGNGSAGALPFGAGAGPGNHGAGGGGGGAGYIYFWDATPGTAGVILSPPAIFCSGGPC